MPRKSIPTTKEEAAHLLASAIHYCLEAGIEVAYLMDSDGVLWLRVPGFTVQEENGEPTFVVSGGAIE